ncbi:MAG: hypothetical protein N3D16_00625 [Anaerolineales bacterium]|nr:hypothetical protein [Anaerolineales bacterium]
MTNPKLVEHNALKKLKWVDGVFLICLFLFTALFTLERIQWDYPNVFLGGDAANIVSFALAKNHPELFARDFLLSERRNFDIYLQFHVFYTQWLEKLFGNAILAFLSLLPITILLYLGGLYFLGRAFFVHPRWAIVFTVLNALPIYLPVDDIGIQTDPLPRTLFHGILSFLLAFLWKWRDQPKRWWVLSAGLGGLVYIHAVSAPAWILAFWFSFIYLMPREWNIAQRMKWIAVLSLVIMGALIPFIQNYLQNTIQARTLPEGIDYLNFMKIFHTYYNSPSLHQIPLTTLTIIKILTKKWIFPLGVLGCLIPLVRNQKQKQQIYLTLLWLVAIVSVSILIPFIEKKIELRFQILPLQTELFRGVRFVPYLLSIFVIMGLRTLHDQLSIVEPYKAVFFIGFVCLMLFRVHGSSSNLDLIRFPKTVHCVQEQQLLFCQKVSKLTDVILFLRENTPRDAAVFFAPIPRDTSALAVRYMAHRSLVYSWKDRGIGFAFPDKLIEWYQIYAVLIQHKNPRRWLSKDPDGFATLMRDLRVDYLIMVGSCSPKVEYKGEFRIKTIFRNSDYSVCQIDN